MMPLKGITIFIPVYNEEALLTPNTGRLFAYLESLGIPFEIIIGSNGSTDRSVSIMRELCEEHSEIRHFHIPEKGVGAAFRKGVDMAQFGHIITVDMDLSVDLGFIIMAHRRLNRCDMVIGSKVTGNQKRSWIRKMASNSFINLAKLLLQINFHDYSISAKGYRKELVEKYLPYVDNKTFYVVEIVYRAYHDGKRLKEIPVECIDMRESRFNLIHEGIYKFGNLFRLWVSSIRRC